MADFPKLADLPDDMTVGQLKSMAERLRQPQAPSTAGFTPRPETGPKLSDRSMSFGETLRDAVGDAGDHLGFDPRSSADYGRKIASGFAPFTALGNLGWEGAKDIEKAGKYDGPILGHEGSYLRSRGAGKILTNVGAPFMGAGTAAGVGFGGLAASHAYDTFGPDAAEAKTRRSTYNAGRVKTAGDLQKIKDDSAERLLNLQLNADRTRNQDALNAEKQKIADEIAAAEARHASAVQLEKENQDREDRRPFRDKHRALNDNLWLATMGVGGVFGAGTRATSNAIKNHATKGWNEAIDEADFARRAMTGNEPAKGLAGLFGRKAPADAGNLEARTIELELRNAAHAEKLAKLANSKAPRFGDGITKASIATGIGIGAEAQMLPIQFDSSLPPDSPDAKAAKAFRGTKEYYGGVAGNATLGALGAKTGDTFGKWGRVDEAPFARSQGFTNAARKPMSEAAVAPVNPVAPVAKAKKPRSTRANPETQAAYKDAKAEGADLVKKKSRATTKDEIKRLEDLIKENELYVRRLETNWRTQMDSIRPTDVE